MSIQTELTRITNAKAAIKTAIEGKGVTVPDGTLLDGMAALIESIEAGGGSGTVESGGVFGTYTVANDLIIGTSSENAIKISTGLSQVHFFAFLLDDSSSFDAAKMIGGIWIYNDGSYFGSRFQQSTSTPSSVYKAANRSTNQSPTFYDSGNGVMVIPGCTSAAKICAGDTYRWFAM